MRKKRHNYSPEEKVFILKRHLVGWEAISDLCDEYQLQPKIFYDWQSDEARSGSGKMAKERHRTRNEASPGGKIDRIKCQKSRVFVKKMAGEGRRE